MNKEKEFEKVKEILKKNIRDARCGIYFSRNTAGDFMFNLYTGDNFIVDICYHWQYYEVFGCNAKEITRLKMYYKKILAEDYKLEDEE